jgi:hypothetical protein
MGMSLYVILIHLYKYNAKKHHTGKWVINRTALKTFIKSSFVKEKGIA